MKTALLKCLSAALIITSIPYYGRATVKLAYLFSDNMVLQQQSTPPIWGWAAANSKITIETSWDKKKYTTLADAAGKWKTQVHTPVAGGPYTVTISDGTPVKLSNVLIGEVWFCTGQSNMEMPVKGFRGQPITGSNDAIVGSANSNIRLFTVPRSSVTTLRDTIKANTWKEANPESVSNFSATGYFFGRMLNRMLGVPVGLVCDSYSGSSIEAWMSPEVLKDFPNVKIPGATDSIKEVSRTPTTLYNGMLHAAAGYGMKGCIWYQGESNREDPDTYEKLFPAMVKQWRAEWNEGDFPFYYAQIAPYDYEQLAPHYKGGKYNSAYQRDVQRKLNGKIPNSAMAVMMDIGEKNCIHPAHKSVSGERLALLALSKTYGMQGFAAESPEYDSLMIKDSVATVRFSKAPMWLIPADKEKELTTFEIAGADKVFYPAKAVIKKNTVEVTSPNVPKPVAVRYAFKDFVVGDLFGTEGLPVSSFRTDDW